MSDKVALVTGGVGELGRSICERLAKQGCRVAALDIVLAKDGEDGRSWRTGLAGEGCEVALIEGDVTDIESCARAVARTECEFGPVDILVNCAGSSAMRHSESSTRRNGTRCSPPTSTASSTSPSRLSAG